MAALGAAGPRRQKFPGFPELLTSEYAIKLYGQGHVVAHNYIAHWHDGIDIAAKAGTPIRAAGDGKVVFSSRLGGYGNTIIIRNADNFFTTYAHNKRNLAKKGQNVKKGDLIANVGATGNASGAHCHFEIRHRQKARNPLFFLPVKK